MNLKEKLRKIAKEKILKSQTVVTSKKSCVAKLKKPHVAQSKVKRVDGANRLPKYFPEAPIDFFVYNKPPEARLQNDKVRELAKKFLESAQVNKNNKKRGKLGAVTESLLKLRKPNQNNESDKINNHSCQVKKIQ